MTLLSIVVLVLVCQVAWSNFRIWQLRGALLQLRVRVFALERPDADWVKAAPSETGDPT